MEAGIFYHALCFLWYIRVYIVIYNSSSSVLQPARRKNKKGKENDTFIQEHFQGVAHAISTYVLLVNIP